MSDAAGDAARTARPAAPGPAEAPDPIPPPPARQVGPSTAPHPPPAAPPPGVTVAAVAAGGVCGALARHALALAWPAPPAGFAWATLLTNLTGCLLIGVLAPAPDEASPRRRLRHAFLGTGVLGGYTTFSAAALDVDRAVAAGHPAGALAYLVATAGGALAAVWAGAAARDRVRGAR